MSAMAEQMKEKFPSLQAEMQEVIDAIGCPKKMKKFHS